LNAFDDDAIKYFDRGKKKDSDGAIKIPYRHSS
jgi:hypothetical protein